MLGLVLIFVLFVVGFYGSQHGNYWGYGQSVVRSSFVRYSLPIYALCAVGVACAWVHLPQLTHGTRMALACRGALALVVAVGLAAGVMVSYDTQHYGFGRSNSYREHGLRIQAFLDASAEEEMAQEGRTLVIGGPNTSKLISVSKYPDAFEWDHVPRSDWDQTILPVIRSALAQRITTIVLLDQQDSEFFAYLQTHFSLRGPRLHPSNHAFLSLEGSIAIVQGEKAR